MNAVKIYTKTHCPYSLRAKALLRTKGVHFEEVDILEYPERTDEMVSAAGGGTTVPQIFIAGKHIGGSDELEQLDDKGELEGLLGSPDDRPYA